MLVDSDAKSTMDGYTYPLRCINIIHSQIMTFFYTNGMKVVMLSWTIFRNHWDPPAAVCAIYTKQWVGCHGILQSTLIILRIRNWGAGEKHAVLHEIVRGLWSASLYLRKVLWYQISRDLANLHSLKGWWSFQLASLVLAASRSSANRQRLSFRLRFLPNERKKRGRVLQWYE